MQFGEPNREDMEAARWPVILGVIALMGFFLAGAAKMAGML